MKFEFDETKHLSNIEKHGVGFEEAAYVLLVPSRLDCLDNRSDYAEERWVTLGEMRGRVFAVVYTIRGNVLRIILARKANAREQEKYRSLRS